MDLFTKVWKEAKDIIDSSPVPEDPIHARNTLKWLLRLYPKADKRLRLASLVHDIERAIPEKKVKREDYRNYECFKKAHAKNSAIIIKEIMERNGICKEAIKDVVFLVENHETGGSFRADLLKEADSLSFFDVNLHFYAKRHSSDEVIDRCIWGYRRLSDKGKKLALDILRNKNLTWILKKLLKE